MADFNDDLTFKKPITATSTVDLSGATITYPAGTSGSTTTGQRPVQFYECPFLLADITDGTKTETGFPENIIVLGAHIVMTTALAFSAGTTTGVSVTIGNADADALGLTTALAGVAGYRRPVPGVHLGGAYPGGSDGITMTFTATGGTPLLAEVSAGAGKLVVHFLEI